MNRNEQIYNQRIKDKALKIITSVAIACAVITSTTDTSPGVIIALLGVAAIQWFRAERAARRVRELITENRKAGHNKYNPE